MNYSYSKNAVKVYEKLYLRKGETIDECHARVAKFLAENDDEFDAFKAALDDQRFRVNTPCMINAGVKDNPNCCACFILDLEDSMESIINMWGVCARIYEGGGGVGIPITNLREKGSPISSGGEASGPLSYLEVIQAISEQVKSGGRCLAPFQKVFTSNGCFTVENLAKTGDKFITIVFDRKANEKKAMEAIAYKSGRKTIYKLTTDKDSFYLSSDHPVILADKRKRLLKNLNIGNRLKAFNCLRKLDDNNHYVVSIEKLGMMDVYDVEIQCDSTDEERNEFLRNFPIIGENYEEGEIESKGIFVSNSRRAANLISFKYNHPDTERIIDCKKDKNTFAAMNLSVLVDNKFMKNIDDDQACFDILSPKNEEVIGKAKYKDLWKKVVHRAWEMGDPGLLFYNRINEDNPFYEFKDIVCSNPCAEVVGMPWTSCVLGHINLTKYVYFMKSGNSFRLAMDLIKKDIYTYVLMLNRIIDKTGHPSSEFKEHMEKYRPIGLGIMGIADVLIKMGIPYGSKEACELLESIMQHVTTSAFENSITIAEMNLTKTKIIPVVPGGEKFIEFIQSYVPDFYKNNKSIVNSTVTCIAPTGSTSISADCSYGMEPLFALVWNKVLDNGEIWPFIHKGFEKACEEKNIQITDDLLEKIINNKGSIQGLNEFPEAMQRLFITAHDIHWKDRINMQAAAQKNTTMSISSTVNLPNSATKEDVADIYKYAWQSGLKGITVYRDGCHENQPVNFGGKKEIKKEIQKIRPAVRTGKTIEIGSPNGKLYITGNSWDDKLQEVFISMSNQDTRTNHLLNSFGRLLSRALQCGVPVESLVDTMRGGGGEVFWVNYSSLKQSVRTSGLIDVLALVIDTEFLENKQINECNDALLDRCPQCHRQTLRRDIGCRGGACIDPNCLYSNCS